MDMKNTLKNGDILLLYKLGSINRLDIIVLDEEKDNEKIIKRVIGLPGETVAIKKGKMAATVAQKPDLMGATAVETAIKIINGEAVEKSIPVEVELVTK